MEQFIITREWIFNNRTERGAWTKKQIEALGLKWPTTSGWIDELVGEAISSHNARIFEESAKIILVKKKENSLTADKCIAYLFKNVDRLSSADMVRLMNVRSKYLDQFNKGVNND